MAFSNGIVQLGGLIFLNIVHATNANSAASMEGWKWSYANPHTETITGK